MWVISPPEITGCTDDLLAVLPKRQNSTDCLASAAELDRIAELYAKYESKLGRPLKSLAVPNLRDDLVVAIKNSFAEVQQDRKLANLRNRLKLAANQCPYCGFGELRDLDHHLPKELFKVFSIFPLNLIPCCSTCNGKKARKPASVRSKQWVHAYLEDVNVYDFLRCVVAISTHGALETEYRIVQRKGMRASLTARLRHHLDEYGLQDRYMRQANIFLSSQLVAFQDMYGAGGGDSLKEYLARTADSHVTQFGANDWRTALFRGVAKCPDFYNGGFLQALGRRAVAP